MFTIIENIIDPSEGPGNWVVYQPTLGEWICLCYPQNLFSMYEYVFREMGLQFPYSDSHISVFNWVDMAPSQLHPNTISFIGISRLYVSTSKTSHFPYYFVASTSGDSLQMGNIVGCHSSSRRGFLKRSQIMFSPSKTSIIWYCL